MPSVRTTISVYKYAQANAIEMPITEGVYNLIEKGVPVQEVLQSLMIRPASTDSVR